MPKLKTHRGAAKRVKVKGSGRATHRCKDRNHILTKKSSKRKRQLRKNRFFKLADVKALGRLLVRKIRGIKAKREQNNVES